MTRPPGLVVVGLLLVPVAAFSPATAEAALEFGAVTTITSEGSRYVRLSLPVHAELTSVVVATASERAVVIGMDREHSGFFKLKAGWAWAGNGSVPESLPAGEYFVYLLSDAPMTTVLRFTGLQGRVEVAPTSTVRGTFHPLQPSDAVGQAMSAVPLHGARHLSGTQPFEGVAFTGFMLVQQLLSLEVEAHEYRWSNPAGVTRCFGHLQGGGGVGSGSSVTGVFSFENNGPVASLDYFRTGASVYHQDDLYGFWVERAPGHAAGPENPAYGIPLRELDASLPDVGCLRSAPPRLPLPVP